MRLLKLLPRFHRAYRAIDRINGFHKKNAGSIQAHQLEQLNRVWGLAFSSVPYYRSLKSSLSLPDQFNSLSEFSQRVPVLEKNLVRDQGEQFLSQDSVRGRWMKTGGSTGEPTRVFWSQKAHLQNLQLRYAWMARFGVDIFDNQAFLWGNSRSAASGIQDLIQQAYQPLEDRLRNRFRFDTHEITNSDLDLYLQQMQRKKIRMVYGYSSVVMLLAKRAMETGVELKSLKFLVMTGEVALPGYAELIEKAFGALCKVEYGSVECGILALENQSGILEVQDSARFLETIPRSDGLHDIVVTVLDNPAFPLFRYRIGDTTSQPARRNENGITVLAEVLGRSNDFLVSSNGDHIHANAVKHALETVLRVKRFRAIQELDGSLEVLVENEEVLEDVQTKFAIQKLKQLLGEFAVRIRHVPSIPANLAGKHLWVTSRLYENRISTS